MCGITSKDIGLLNGANQSILAPTVPNTTSSFNAAATSATQPTTPIAPPVTLAVNSELPQASSVATNMDSLLSSGSPYLDRAQSLSTQKANSRGLINSTMAAQAGTAAAIDASLPIAQADTASQNNFKLSDFNAQNTTNLANAEAVNKTSMMTYTTQADAITKALQRQQDILINNVGISATSADRVYTATLDSIAKIQASNMDAAQKNKAVADILGMQIDQGLLMEQITGQNGFQKWL